MPIITPLYAGLCGILILFLAFGVVKMRRTYKIGLGIGDNEKLETAVRVHGNALENIPLILILLFFAELQGLPALVIHGFGVALVLSRVLHAWGLGSSTGVSFGRFYGTLISWLLILFLAIINILKYVLALAA